MRNGTWWTGLTGSVASVSLLAGCGLPGALRPAPPAAQRQIYQQPVTNRYPAERWGQTHSLIDLAADTARNGQTADAFALLMRSRDTLQTETGAFGTGDPQITALRRMIDQAIETIRTTPVNSREVTTIVTRQIQDAFANSNRPR